MLALAACLVATAALMGASTAHAQGFTRHTAASDVEGARSLVAADINGDGSVDIVSVSADIDDDNNITNSEVAWYESDGAATPSFTQHVLPSSLVGPRDAAAADLDGDGDTDILAVSIEENDSDRGKVMWYESDGADTPSFAEHELATGASRPRSVETMDLNEDGHLDIVVGVANSTEILWFEHDGNGADPTFTQRVLTSQAPGVADMHLSDIDGDGDVDIAAALLEGGGGMAGNRIMWYENQGPDGGGDYTFARHTIQADAEGAIAVHVADVNGDGALDVVAASKDDDTVAWYENDAGNPGASFTQHVLTTEADDARSVYAADGDGDGDVDIFAASGLDDTVRAFANMGGGDPAFQELTVSESVGGATWVTAALINDDDKLDVIAAASTGDEIVWFENEHEVLPVELVAFRGVVEGDEVVLRWRTLSETSNDGFAVERKQEVGFEEIGYVRGAGTTSETQHYTFRTDPLESGTHVFRLKQIDRDGTFAYSEEIEVAITMKDAFTLTSAYPNPFRDEARLDLRVRESQRVRVDVFNALGQRVKRLHDGPMAANNETSLVVEGDRLPSGTYLIRAVGEDFQTTRRVTLVK